MNTRDRIWTNTPRRAAVAVTVGMVLFVVVWRAVTEGGFTLAGLLTAVLWAGLFGVSQVFLQSGVARRERKRSGAPDGEAAEIALGRALRTGEPPADPELNEPLRRLVDLRRRGNGRSPVVVPASLLIGAAGFGVAAAVSGASGLWMLVALFIALASGSYVLLVRQFRRFDRLDAALGRA